MLQYNPSFWPKAFGKCKRKARIRLMLGRSLNAGNASRQAKRELSEKNFIRIKQEVWKQRKED